MNIFMELPDGNEALIVAEPTSTVIDLLNEVSRECNLIQKQLRLVYEECILSESCNILSLGIENDCKVLVEQKDEYRAEVEFKNLGYDLSKLDIRRAVLTGGDVLMILLRMRALHPNLMSLEHLTDIAINNSVIESIRILLPKITTQPPESYLSIALNKEDDEVINLLYKQNVKITPRNRSCAVSNIKTPKQMFRYLEFINKSDDRKAALKSQLGIELFLSNFLRSECPSNSLAVVEVLVNNFDCEGLTVTDCYRIISDFDDNQIQKLISMNLTTPKSLLFEAVRSHASRVQFIINLNNEEAISEAMFHVKDPNALPHLIEAGGDINTVNENGLTPLLTYSDSMCVVKAIEHGADITILSPNNRSILHFHLGPIVVTKVLKTLVTMTMQHNINIRESGGSSEDCEDPFEVTRRFINLKTTSGTAAIHTLGTSDVSKRSETLRQLLLYKADVEIQDSNGNTICHLLQERTCSLDSLRSTIEICRSMNVTLNLNAKNKLGKRPIDLSVLRNRYNHFDILIQNGASVSGNGIVCSSIMSKSFDQMMSCIKTHPCLQNSQHLFHELKGTRNAIHFAAEAEQLETIQLLLKESVDCHLVDYNGMTPLSLAIIKGNVAISRLLIDQGAGQPPNIHEVMKDLLFESKIINCVDNVNHVISLIKSENWTLPPPTAESVTIIHVASTKKEHVGAEVLRLLIDNNLYDVNLRGPMLWTPLHYAASHNNVPAVEFLLEAGADFSSRGRSSDTAIHVSNIHGCRESVEVLKNYGENFISELPSKPKRKLPPIEIDIPSWFFND